MKNHYATLGISPDESPDGIRAAYRNAVRRTHPDHAGPQGATAFQEIVEANQVLSDPDRRREYNEALSREQAPRLSAALANDVAGPPPNQDTAAPFSIEVILTPAEAASATEISIPIPHAERCPMCAGTGGLLFTCLICRGEGRVAMLEPIRVAIPTELRRGFVSQIGFEPQWFGRVFLSLTLRVSDTA